ncbi:MAG: tape measure protein, partial [Gammaproteobacteria bacterium]
MANSKIQITISANEKPFRQALQQSFAELKKFSSDTQRIAQQFASLSQFSAKPITPFKIDAASLGSLDKFEQAFRRIQQIKFDDASIAARVRRVGQAFAEQTASVNRARAALAQFQAAQGGATAGASRFASSVAATALGFSAFTVAARVIDGIKNALVGAAQAAAEFESAQSRIQGITESQLATADAFRFTGDEAKRLKADIGTLRSSYADLLLLQSEGILTTREAQAIQEGLVNVQKRGGASNESLRLSMTGLKQILTAVNVTWEDYKQVTENLPALAGPLVRAFGQVTNGAVKNQQDLKNL